MLPGMTGLNNNGFVQAPVNSAAHIPGKVLGLSKGDRYPSRPIFSSTRC